jgi:hypothetical protein
MVRGCLRAGCRCGDVVVLRRVLEQAGRPVLEGIAVESFTTRLRGPGSEQHLARLTGAGAARKVTLG